jgi:CRISPR-associated endonuclease Csn1
MVAKIDRDEAELLNYCENVLGLKEPQIVWKKIAIKSLVCRDGYRMYVSGKANGGERIVLWNAVNLCLNQKNIAYIREIEKFKEKGLTSEVITKEKNIELYSILMKKHADEIYARKPGSIGTVLQESLEKFKEINLEDQCYTLYQILTISSIAKVEIDLSRIGGKKNAGATNIGKTLSEKNHLYLINQSVTGIYEQVIDLLTV